MRCFERSLLAPRVHAAYRHRPAVRLAQTFQDFDGRGLPRAIGS